MYYFSVPCQYQHIFVISIEKAIKTLMNLKMIIAVNFFPVTDSPNCGYSMQFEIVMCCWCSLIVLHCICTHIFHINSRHVPHYIKTNHSAYTSHSPSHTFNASVPVITHFPVWLWDKHQGLRNPITYPVSCLLPASPPKTKQVFKILDFLSSLSILIDHGTQFQPMRYKGIPKVPLCPCTLLPSQKVNVRPGIQQAPDYEAMGKSKKETSRILKWKARENWIPTAWLSICGPYLWAYYVRNK